MIDDYQPPKCLICGGSLTLFEFLKLSTSVFSAFENREPCPRCGEIFYIESEGHKWWKDLEGKPRTKPGHCEFCGRLIEGSSRRIYCNRNCKQAAYRKNVKKLRSERNA